jgi:hypothetical protein
LVRDSIRNNSRKILKILWNGWHLWMYVMYAWHERSSCPEFACIF